MANDEEDYIDVEELKTEEAVIEETKKKPSFGSRLSSTFKSAGQKVSAGASSVARSGGEAVKKGYASYKASQTPEAKQKRYEAELTQVKRKTEITKARGQLATEQKKLPSSGGSFGGNVFGGGMGGMNRDSSGGFGSSLPGMNNPMGGGSIGGSMGSPFSGNMVAPRTVKTATRSSKVRRTRTKSKPKTRSRTKARSTTKPKKVLSMQEFEREQKYKKYLSSTSRSKPRKKTTMKRKVARKPTRRTKKRSSPVAKPQSNQMRNPFG